VMHQEVTVVSNDQIVPFSDQVLQHHDGSASKWLVFVKQQAMSGLRAAVCKGHARFQPPDNVLTSCRRRRAAQRFQC